MAGFLDMLRNPALADLLMSSGQGLIAAGSGDQSAFARMPLMFSQLQQQRASDRRTQQADARDQALFDMKLKEQQRAEEKRQRDQAFVDSMLSPSAAPTANGSKGVRRFNPGESVILPGNTEPSTELLMSVMGDPRMNGGRPTNIPSLWMVDGKPYKANSEDEAIGLALKAGGSWPTFGTIDEAVASAKNRSAHGGRFQDTPASTRWADILTPEQITAIRGMDPTSAIALMGERAFAQPDKFTPDLETFNEGDYEVTGYWDQDGNWIQQSRAPRWQAPQPKEAQEMWEPYTDPKTGKTGQKSTKSGKVDWDPGQSGGMSIDLNGDGIPEFTTGATGRPPTEAQTKAANQFTLMGNALNDVESLLSQGGVSAWRMAGADMADEYGAAGRLVGQSMLSPEDKQFQAARAGALESLANSITGAAFTEEQKNNFIKMLPQATDDGPTSAFKLKRMRDYLAQLERNAGRALPPKTGGAPDLKSKYGLE